MSAKGNTGHTGDGHGTDAAHLKWVVEQTLPHLLHSLLDLSGACPLSVLAYVSRVLFHTRNILTAKLLKLTVKALSCDF